MSADLVIANMLRIAREDLDGAKTLAGLGNRNAAYLCEQAAEKLIRAVLTAENKHAVSGTSSTRWSISCLTRTRSSLRCERSKCSRPTRRPIAIRPRQGRIPNAISGGELTAHIERVDAALGEAVRHFGVDLDKKGTPARTPKPIR